MNSSKILTAMYFAIGLITCLRVEDRLPDSLEVNIKDAHSERSTPNQSSDPKEAPASENRN